MLVRGGSRPRSRDALLNTKRSVFVPSNFFAGAPLRQRGAYSLDILVHFLRSVDTTRGLASVWRDFSSPRPQRITVASTALITL